MGSGQLMVTEGDKVLTTSHLGLIGASRPVGSPIRQQQLFLHSIQEDGSSQVICSHCLPLARTHRCYYYYYLSLVPTTCTAAAVPTQHPGRWLFSGDLLVLSSPGWTLFSSSLLVFSRLLLTLLLSLLSSPFSDYLHSSSCSCTSSQRWLFTSRTSDHNALVRKTT